MNICVYHTNLHLFGGGELVAATVASEIARGHDVTLLTGTRVAKEELQDFFCLDLADVNLHVAENLTYDLDMSSAGDSSTFLTRAYDFLETFDLVVDTCTNGWFDRRLSCASLCYVACPVFSGALFDFNNPNSVNAKNSAGLVACSNVDSDYHSPLRRPDSSFQYDMLLCNSRFTQKYVRKFTSAASDILYPPVYLPHEQDLAKRGYDHRSNKIVSIGRFSRDKQFEVLIEAFRALSRIHAGCELHLIGTFRKEYSLYENEYLEQLLGYAQGLPVYFHYNLSHSEVLRFLLSCRVYWHARGFSREHPAAYESFGISTAEAMGCGCLPVVINLGAQCEIVTHGINGYCWNTLDELVNLSLLTLDNDNERMRERGLYDAQEYSTDNFRCRLNQSIDQLAGHK